ncbi:MAG TPA: hypothetical protein VGE37_07770, partial [Archangium sp.]
MVEVVVLSVILLVALSAPDDVSPREAIRFRGAVSLVGAAGYAFPSSNFSAAPGVSAEAGVVFTDSVSVVARGTFATLLLMSVIHAGASVDLVLVDRLSLGVGLSFT